MHPMLGYKLVAEVGFASSSTRCSTWLDTERKRERERRSRKEERVVEEVEEREREGKGEVSRPRAASCLLGLLPGIGSLFYDRVSACLDPWVGVERVPEVGNLVGNESFLGKR